MVRIPVFLLSVPLCTGWHGPRNASSKQGHFLRLVSFWYQHGEELIHPLSMIKTEDNPKDYSFLSRKCVR